MRDLIKIKGYIFGTLMFKCYKIQQTDMPRDTSRRGDSLLEDIPTSWYIGNDVYCGPRTFNSGIIGNRVTLTTVEHQVPYLIV